MEDITIINEAAKNSKRKKIEDLVYNTIDILDNTGRNTKIYKDKLSKLTDQQFDKFIKDFLKDDSSNFYLEIIPFENEPSLDQVKKSLDYLGIPLEEYVYFKHGPHKEDPIRTKEKVPVGYLSLRRLQQILFKKNSYSIDIDVRNPKT
jgi:hypothetical protein